jgi:uncharacterized protein YjbJ (UPF0337 family)
MVPDLVAASCRSFSSTTSSIETIEAFCLMNQLLGWSLTPIRTKKTGSTGMNTDQLAGTAKRMAGKAEETLGSAFGDAKSRVEGAARQAEGAAQELYGQAKDTVASAASAAADVAQQTGKAVTQGASDLEKYLRDTIENRPYTAVIVAFLAGCVVSRFIGGRDY